MTPRSAHRSPEWFSRCRTRVPSPDSPPGTRSDRCTTAGGRPCVPDRSAPRSATAHDLLAGLDGLYHGAVRLTAAADVVHGRLGRSPMELGDRADEVATMDVVADLLAAVAEDGVALTRDRASHEVGKEAVQLSPAWFGPVRQPPRKQTVDTPNSKCVERSIGIDVVWGSEAAQSWEGWAAEWMTSSRSRACSPKTLSHLAGSESPSGILARRNPFLLRSWARAAAPPQIATRVRLKHARRSLSYRGSVGRHGRCR